jgi:hypothetical protein
MRPHNIQLLAASAQRLGPLWVLAQGRVRLWDSVQGRLQLMWELRVDIMLVDLVLLVASVHHRVWVDLVRLRLRDWQEPVASEVVAQAVDSELPQVEPADSVLHQAEPADLARQRTPQPALGLIFLQDSAHRWLQRE